MRASVPSMLGFDTYVGSTVIGVMDRIVGRLLWPGDCGHGLGCLETARGFWAKTTQVREPQEALLGAGDTTGGRGSAGCSPGAQAKGDTAIFLVGLPGAARWISMSILVARWISDKTWLGMSVVCRFLKAISWWCTRFGVGGLRRMLASSGVHGSLFMHGCCEGGLLNAGGVGSAGLTSAGLHECRSSGAGVPSHVMVPGRWGGAS